MSEVTVRKSENPALFDALVREDIARRLKSLEDTKRSLSEKGVPSGYWVYIDANFENRVPGYMLGALFSKEEYLVDRIRRAANAEVFHFDSVRGNQVSVVADVRDEKTILFYLGDSLSVETYRKIRDETTAEQV